ncbi:PH domain-containing protein [Nonomuraea jabiensis]|uniref:Putative membrane protein n=1 Tax=Nonomuraea jabiensis TaxID=882448 RepID=A0A7W9G9A9_9ACTN|nr:PH domain-containing protein [Nonomuraea jabiensis]MBB5779599.1 putative membrane protein [Nonomuraea jabiensis]
MNDGTSFLGEGWRRLAGRSLWASAVKSLAVVAGVVAALLRFLIGRDWPIGAVVAVCAAAAMLVVAAVVAYDVARLRTTRWRLTPERLELRSGITVRQHRSIPLDRVRSVNLRADPVARVFGLTVVKVGTGEHAAEGTELVLDPLSRHEAESLRRTLLRQDERPASGDGPLAELRWSWIRYAPLSLWSFTGAALVLGALYKALDWFGAKRFATEAADGLWDWVTARPLVAVPLILAANLAVGVLGAVLLFAESWGRYRLEREPGRLRLHRGLLTTRSLTLEERRLRGVEISEPLLLRLGGGARVMTIATGLGKADEHETEDAAALAPPLPRALAWSLATKIAALPTAPPPAAPRADAALATPPPSPLRADAFGRTGMSAATGPAGRAPRHAAPADAPWPATRASGPGTPGRHGTTGRDASAGAAAERRGAGAGGLWTDGLETGGLETGALETAGLETGGLETGGLGMGALVPHPAAARRRRIVRALVTVAVLAAAAGLASWLLPWQWSRAAVWAIPALALPFGMWLAVESARSLGHALGRRYLVVRRGAVVRSTIALDRGGVSGWTITESYLQRRAGLLTVSAATAAGKGHYDVVDVDRGDGLELAARAVPGLLEPFLVRERK